MRVIHDVEETKAHLRALQAQGLRLGFVPTMGALHAGHLSLIAAAKENAEVVVASIFVNPTQFGPGEDYEQYPKTLDKDCAQLEAAGCDVVFAPSAAGMYPKGFQTKVTLSDITQGLCGAHRPGHFDGVSSVVLKLLSIVRPDVAVFGEKDYQQLQVIRQMATDLNLDVEIIGAPLVRDPDGLAMSSRNAYLSDGERTQALSLSRGLDAARLVYESGQTTAQALLDAAGAELDKASVDVEYLELRHARTLESIEHADQPSVILVAARVGSTRLIDNLILRRT